MKSHHLMWIFWPSFLVACLLEAVVFTFVDPLEIMWPLGDFEVTRQGIYTLGFFLLWSVVGFACALTLYLAQPPQASEWRWHPRR